MPLPTEPDKRRYMFTDDIKFLQKAIIFHPTEQKFLILKRALFHKYNIDKWDLAGGNVLYGELHLDSLIKEIQEETGLEVTDIKPAEVITRKPEDMGFYFLLINYTCKAISDQVTISNEHTEFRWVSKTEFLQLEGIDVIKNFVVRNA